MSYIKLGRFNSRFCNYCNLILIKGSCNFQSPSTTTFFYKKDLPLIFSSHDLSKGDSSKSIFGIFGSYRKQFVVFGATTTTISCVFRSSKLSWWCLLRLSLFGWSIFVVLRFMLPYPSLRIWFFAAAMGFNQATSLPTSNSNKNDLQMVGLWPVCLNNMELYCGMKYSALSLCLIYLAPMLMVPMSLSNRGFESSQARAQYLYYANPFNQ